MKNLEKFGVETLSTQEMRETDGGGIIGDIVDALKELDANWDELKKRFRDGYNSYEGCSCH